MFPTYLRDMPRFGFVFFMAVITSMFTCVVVYGDTDMIAWERKSITVQVGLNDAQAKLSFRGKNLTDRPVVIHSVSTTCGCTKGAASRSVVRPGEDVTIAAIVDVKSAVGALEQRVFVFYEGEQKGELRRDRLCCTVEVLSPVSVAPSMVTWAYGEPLRTKRLTATITGADLQIAKFGKVSSSNKKIRATVVESTETRRVIELEPSEGPEDGVISIQCEILLDGKPQQRCCYIPVKVE